MPLEDKTLINTFLITSLIMYMERFEKIRNFSSVDRRKERYAEEIRKSKGQT